MKLKYDFAVREIVGEYIMVPLGAAALKFSGMISTSETGAALAEALKEHVTRQELLQQLLEQYDIDEATAAADLDLFLDQLRKLDLLIE
jgi:hypothetical protein